MADRSLPLLKSDFARNVAVLAGGTIGGQGLVVLATPVITRLYSPAEMGALAVYMSLLTMTLSFVSLRYEAAIPLPKDDRSAANLLVLCFAILVGVCGALVFPVVFFAEAIASRFNAVELSPYLWLLPLGLLAAGSYQVLSSWAVRKRAFTTIARTKLSQSIAQVGTQVGLGALGAGPVGLLLGDVAGRAGGSGSLAALLLARDRTPLGTVTLRGMRSAAHRYRHFPLVSSISSLLNNAGLQLPLLLLAALYDPVVAGLFALSQRAVGIPMQLVGHSIAQVYVGEASQLVRNEPARMKEIFDRATRRLLLFGAPPLIGVALLAPWIFTGIFGSDWGTSGTYLQLLVPAFIAQFVVSPVSQTAILLERQGLQLVGDLARALLVIASLWVPRILGWSSHGAIATYSACMVVTYVGYYLLYRKALREGQRTSIRQEAFDVDG